MLEESYTLWQVDLNSREAINHPRLGYFPLSKAEH